MALIQRLQSEDDFPPSSEALDYPNGLLAVGGELNPARLLGAYRRGIFPWFETPHPVMWWTPDPRSVLFPEELHISRSLARTLRRDNFRLSVDQRFDEVMARCGEERAAGPGTWINPAMLSAYGELHRLGYAHSIEVMDQSDTLVGGLYGVAIGRVFFGESMFSTVRDASKVALVALVRLVQAAGFRLIDCQVESDHLNSLGARNISRLDFEQLLAQTRDSEPAGEIWTIPGHCGALS